MRALAVFLFTLSSMADDAGDADAASPQGSREPAFRDASVGHPAARSRRSFAVEAWAGRKIAGWPLGHFDVGADGVRVRLGFPWFVTRSAGKDAITSVSIARTWTGRWCLRFEDSGQHLADVRVQLPVRAQRVIDELRRCGYPVTDQKTGQPVIRLPKSKRAA